MPNALGGLYAFTGHGYDSGRIRVGVSCDYKARLTAETCTAFTDTGRYWIREIEVFLHGKSEPGYAGPRPDPSAYRAYQLRTVFRALAGLIFLLPAAALARQERAGRTSRQWYGWLTVLSMAVFLTDFAISWWCSQTITNALSLPGLRITGLHWGPPWSLGYLVFGAMAYLQYRTLAKRASQAAVKVESTPMNEGTGS